MSQPVPLDPNFPATPLRRTLLRRLLPLEIVVLFTALFVVSSYSILGMPPRVLPGFYWAQILATIFVYSQGLFIAALYMIFAAWRSDPLKDIQKARVRAWTTFSTTYLTRERAFRDARLMLGFLLTLALFTHLKHITPLINPLLFDRWFSHFEHVLFGNASPTTRLIVLVGPQAAGFLSNVYTAFYPYMTAVLVFFVLITDRSCGERFALAYCLLWILGTVMIYLAPTWGPVYFEPGSVSLLPLDSKVSMIQQELWRWKLAFDINPKPLGSQFLISGQPSLHIAVTTLGSLYLWRINKTLGILSWTFTALTWVTTIFFGWHYVSDNVLALVLVGISNWIACRAVKPTEI